MNEASRVYITFAEDKTLTLPVAVYSMVVSEDGTLSVYRKETGLVATYRHGAWDGAYLQPWESAE